MGGSLSGGGSLKFGKGGPVMSMGFSPPSFPHRPPSILIMLLQSSGAVLLLCTTAGFLGWLGLAAVPEKEELWETWMRSALDETPVAQLVQHITHQMGNLSSHAAVDLQAGRQVVPPKLHQEQERTQHVHPQPESILVLQEVMEKLQRVNQSLELMLAALEDAQSRLEKHLEHLKAIPDLAGQSQSATSSCIPHSSYFMLLVLPLVPASLQAVLLLLFLASSALGIPATSTLLVLAVAGHWLVASTCRGARRIRPVVPREKPRFRLTSTPERECDLELLQEELDRMEMSCLQGERCPQKPSHLEQPQEVAGDIPGFTGQVSPDPGGQRTTRSSCGVTPEPVMDTGKLWEPKPCSPRANMSPCQGLTRAGKQCRKKAIPGQEFCHVHTTTSSLAMDSSPHF
ncbi:protein brambleberry-like [Oenanthe melanoleuca]|uniref:protein brambleberry-like n=1 Tax=Oenanthe melanoleuca TaxID=2939378 RepID=UPI0024C13139|nr:protein brambleberry-like [Oenanthe melanoleuca]